MTKRFKTARLIAALLCCSILMTAASSCSKSDTTPTPGPGSGATTYPKSVSIEYKVTCLTGGITKVTTLGYTNATGGNAATTDVPLPFSKTITRTVNRYDMINVGVLHNNSATSNPFSLKLEILIDGKLVQTKTLEGTTAVNESLVHSFN